MPISPALLGRRGRSGRSARSGTPEARCRFQAYGPLRERATASTVDERGSRGAGASSPGELQQDLGIGGRVAQQSRARFLNPDGSFNVRREGVPYFRSLGLYDHLLTISWTRFFVFILALYFAVNVAFALLYLACGPGALEGVRGNGLPERFGEAFFFSVQTLATIGYGRMSPSGFAANFLVSLEALAGLLGFALATGICFARFSRPVAHILFSENAVVAPYREGKGLMFRIANERRSQLINVAAQVNMGRIVNGKRAFHELTLERSSIVFMPLHWVIVHPIDEKSPLFGVDEAEFRASDPEIFILLTAVEETFSQTVHARSSYKQGEVAWDARFVDLFVPSQDGVVTIDLSRLSQVEKV